MVARHERAPDRLDQLAGEEAALVERRRRGSSTANSAPAMRATSRRRPSVSTCRSIRRAAACSTASPVARPKAALIAS